MRRLPEALARGTLALLLLLSLAACAVGRIEATTLTVIPMAAGQYVAAPVRVHLADGTTVVFRHGATFERDSVRGAGEGWLLSARDPLPVTAVAREKVVAAESFRRRTDVRKTLLLNAPLIALSIVMTVAGPVYRAPSR